MSLDLSFVRQQFPALEERPDSVFCANAGGSYLAAQALDSMAHYNRHLRVQPYAGYEPSREAGSAMDRARQGWSRALNIGPDELTFGPSTSMNSYVLAQAVGAGLEVGDEIVVTRQDHEANQGVWRRAAEARGARVREWPVDPADGLLHLDTLLPLLGENTRWVFFTHCSNVIGTVNPVRSIVTEIRTRCAARVCVDGVAYAPHHVPDLGALDVDVYFFSLYKVFGPHQGLMFLRRDVQAELPAQSHYFLHDDSHKRFNPAGPQHAEVAASGGVLDYFDAVYDHHFPQQPAAPVARLARLHELVAAHERALTAPLLQYLGDASTVRLLGKSHGEDHDRAPTIAFVPRERSAREVAQVLQARGIGAEWGHFYAQRVLESVGIDPTAGVVRISLLHYNSEDEVERIVAALHVALHGA